MLSPLTRKGDALIHRKRTIPRNDCEVWYALRIGNSKRHGRAIIERKTARVSSTEAYRQHYLHAVLGSFHSYVRRLPLSAGLIGVDFLAFSKSKVHQFQT